jgi:hypothetical protein
VRWPANQDYSAGDYQTVLENWIKLIGGIVLTIYLFVALTHPEWF